MIAKKYRPQEIPGYVFWSNFGNADLSRRRPDGSYFSLDPESIAHIVAAWWGIAFADVLVVPFTPNGPPTTPFHTAYATYIPNAHKDAVESSVQYLEMMLKALEECDDEF